MPLYDYECPKCGTIKEVQHSVSEIGKIDVSCDDCRIPMKKMLSLPALIGFDNIGRSRNKKDKEEAPKKDTATQDASPKDSTGKTDSKKDTAA